MNQKRDNQFIQHILQREQEYNRLGRNRLPSLRQKTEKSPINTHQPYKQFRIARIKNQEQTTVNSLLVVRKKVLTSITLQSIDY